MKVADLRKETPNVAALLRFVADPIGASIIENVLLGDLAMDWNNGDPLFSMTDNGNKRVEGMLKKAKAPTHD
jgi:hypothetical protein